jgi:hypothetical protein
MNSSGVFPQENATIHQSQRVYVNSENALAHSAAPQTLNVWRAVTGHDFSRAYAVILVLRSQVRGAAAIEASFEISQHLRLSFRP